MSKPKNRPDKGPAAQPQMPAAKPAGKPASTSGSATPIVPIASLFRSIDWWALALTTIVVMVGYMLSLAPNVTLEDSGELSVGSHYAGIPHPPGYPVWTLYTWFFVKLLPVGNIAWRVGVASAFAGALSCGIIAMMVSRGGSMMIEGIAELKTLDKRIENMLCVVTGFMAGMMMGFNGYYWSQAVIVEVYPFSVLSLMGVLACLLRWVYAPQQRRYLYWAAFLFGICFTNHQTLIVAAMGLEVAILAASPKLGRDLFLFNTLVYLLGLWAKSNGKITSFDNNESLYAIYNIIGIGSAVTFTAVAMKTQKVLTEWKPILIITVAWVLGAAFYLYMPLASMSNPPMNWGYPRTVEGFVHAFTRGQYDKTNPTSDVGRLMAQLGMYMQGAVEEFNFVYLLIGLVPFIFYKKLQKRERAWLVGLTAIYLCLAFLLLILLNPSTDRQSREQARVFFTASYVIVAICVGYGLTLIGSLLATQYEKVRPYALWSSVVAAGIALYAWVALKSQFPVDRYTALLGFLLALGAVILTGTAHRKIALPLVLALFGIMPTYTILSHWSDNEQRGHLFGFWFGHDMFTPPFGIYPEMEKNTILFGGTDPGRFCPTYMIFCESFIEASKRRDPKFDRRDVYLITQNALADGTYLNYIRAHYNRSTQVDPPFFANLFRGTNETMQGNGLDRYFTDLGARIEATRRKDGVYPIPEINTPSPEDSQRAFQDYIADAQRRLQHDMQAPNEPKQIKPGEDVRVVDNKISVQGQVAVMAINGLLTKVIFDRNPTNAFYVEESFPLDWMFPYLSPYGIIMKINREPVPEFTEAMIKKDHEFWTRYSERLTGNFITYDTTVSNICAFAERVYQRRDFAGFTGDRKFIRDDNAQKAFSKLRSAIGGLYFWRISNTKNPAENQRLIKEADFAFKQAFAFCPFSPEAVYKYINLLVNVNRAADAEMIVATCLKLDPENTAMQGLAANLAEIRKGQTATLTAQTQLAMIEEQYKANPTNLQLVFQLASAYLTLQRTNQALQLLDQLIANPAADAQTLLSVATAYAQLGSGRGLEAALGKLVKVMPDNAEAWYDWSRAQVTIGKIPEGLKSLEQAFKLSRQRLATTPGAKNLMEEAVKDPNLAAVRAMPEFQKLLVPK